MKIGIIGSGDVGKALAVGFSETGHDVMIGSRSLEKLDEWRHKNNPSLQVGSFKQAGEHGELLVLAVGWPYVQSAIDMVGDKVFGDKILIDVTNPLDFSGGFPPKLAVSGNDSGGETIQRLLPNSKVVKAWNIVGNASMYEPKFKEGEPTMWICGNDDEAKSTITQILDDFGWTDVIDLGDISGSRLLEPLCILWVQSGKKLDNWHIAFKLLKK